MRFFINVLYTFRYRYSLANREFSKDENSVVCAEFPMGSKFNFSQWKIYFSKFIFIDKYWKLKKTEYLIHHTKFKIWPALFMYILFIFNSETQIGT